VKFTLVRGARRSADSLDLAATRHAHLQQNTHRTAFRIDEASQKATNDTMAKKELVRCTMRLHGAELAQVREICELLSLNAEVDACRYLMQRGLEALSAPLGVRRIQRKMETTFSPQEMLPFMEKIANQTTAAIEGGHTP